MILMSSPSTSNVSFVFDDATSFVTQTTDSQ